MRLTGTLTKAGMVGMLSFGMAFGVAAQQPTPAPPAQQPGVQQQQPGFLQAAEREGFREWARGARDAGFEQRLAERPYTVLAAPDAAYQQVPAATRDQWRADPARHRAAVGHTILEGRLTAEDLRTRQYVRTIEGETLPVRTVGDRIMIGDATIDRADIQAGQGVIHGVDRVLLPGQQMAQPGVQPAPAPVQPAPPAQPAPAQPAPVQPAPVREPVRKDPW